MVLDETFHENYRGLPTNINQNYEKKIQVDINSMYFNQLVHSQC